MEEALEAWRKVMIVVILKKGMKEDLVILYWTNESHLIPQEGSEANNPGNLH